MASSDPGAMSEAHAAARAAVAAAYARLSAAWRNARYDELAAALDEHVVMALPGFAGRVEGRDALVQGYRDFMQRATLTHYDEGPPDVDVWGDTAVVTCRWEMRWLDGGEENRAAGHEAFVFRRTAGGEWRAVWRTMAFDAGSGA